MKNIWPHLKFFSPPPRLCWAGYSPGLWRNHLGYSSWTATDWY